LLDHCTCSRDRIHAVLDQMSVSEIAEASLSGEISVRCEFCGLTYNFDPEGYLPNDTAN
jgi:molecular chaperone Hsp33